MILPNNWCRTRNIERLVDELSQSLVVATNLRFKQDRGVRLRIVSVLVRIVGIQCGGYGYDGRGPRTGAVLGEKGSSCYGGAEL